ncbi:serine/threonine-protein kinase [Actinocorallia longicatena]|uniref:non-specific serine/threonine protein kinase n=1 Tax=Actinocorallia longicatena TaxID=111803 RepID=A0ABP6QLV6_9ACTN
MPNETHHRLLARRYRLDAQVGRGGMGTVWQAFDEVLGRDVAVKEVILPFGLSDEERDLQHRRTFREARTAARLAHPGVVTVYDVVEEDDRPWIVMELIKAPSLDKVIKDGGTLTARRAARIGAQMLSALHAAHEAGVLHRDVKPSNVLLAEGDRAVLTDFGIAHATGDATLTATGLVMGSPAYIAPERARGRIAGPSSDLWSLGITLYAMCEGRSPYERSEPMASLLAIISEEPRVSEQAGPLNKVIAGLLRKEPDERMTVHEAGVLLDEIANGKGGAATRPVPRPEPVVFEQPAPPVVPPPASPRDGAVRLGAATVASRARGGGPTLAIVAAIVLVTALVVGGIFWMQTRDGEPEDGAKPTTGTSQKPESGKPSSSPSASASKSSAPPSKSPSATPSTPASGAVPAGFREYKDPTGYSLQVPSDFTGPERRNAENHYFYSPDDQRTMIQIGQTDDPGESAIADWEQQAAGNAIPGYEKVAIVATPDQPPVLGKNGANSADWEFISVVNGVRMHTLNRGFLLNGMGYAILLRAPDSEWTKTLERMRPVFESFKGKS